MFSKHINFHSKINKRSINFKQYYISYPKCIINNIINYSIIDNHAIYTTEVLNQLV